MNYIIYLLWFIFIYLKVFFCFGMKNVFCIDWVMKIIIIYFLVFIFFVGVDEVVKMDECIEEYVVMG